MIALSILLPWGHAAGWIGGLTGEGQRATLGGSEAGQVGRLEAVLPEDGEVGDETGSRLDHTGLEVRVHCGGKPRGRKREGCETVRWHGWLAADATLRYLSVLEDEKEDEEEEEEWRTYSAAEGGRGGQPCDHEGGGP